MLKRSVGGCRMIVSLFAMLALSSQAQLVFDRETSLDEAYAFIGAGTNAVRMQRGHLADAEHRAFAVRLAVAWQHRDPATLSNLLSRTAHQQQPELAAAWCLAMSRLLVPIRAEAPKLFALQLLYDPAQAAHQTFIETPESLLVLTAWDTNRSQIVGREVPLVRQDGELRLTLPGPGQARLVNPRPVVRAVTNAQVFFECRAEEVISIDVDGLRRIYREAASGPNPSPEALAALAQQRPGDATYAIELSSFTVGTLILKPKPGAHGEPAGELKKPDSHFRAALGRLDPAVSAVTFLVRPDSSNVWNQARIIATNGGFRVGFRPLAAEDPVLFSAESMATP